MPPTTTVHQILGMGLLAAPVLRDSALHVHGSYAYEWPTRFLHYRHFFAIPSARQSRFDLQQAQKMAHALVLGVSRNTNNRPAYQHEPRAPIGFRLTSPVWRLCT